MANRRMLLWLGLTVGTLGIISAYVWSEFATALRDHRARVSRDSHIVASTFGQIEFATAGQGVPVLIIHGAGGGFDQALSIAGRLATSGYRLIAPSRFGYLRSSSPSDPSPDNQADAFATLLDELHIHSVAVVGVSAGALSALQFAAHYPDRCRSLIVIVPAASVAANGLPAQGPLPDQDGMTKAIVEHVLKSDFLFWLGITLARDQMIRSVLATDPALVAMASPDERQRAHDILRNIMPIGDRTQGLLNDARFTSEPLSIAFDRIRAPTLAISLEDDFYRTIEPARVIAASIPRARLMAFPSGGHIFVGHDAEVFAEVTAFLREHQGGSTLGTL